MCPQELHVSRACQSTNTHPNQAQCELTINSQKSTNASVPGVDSGTVLQSGKHANKANMS